MESKASEASARSEISISSSTRAVECPLEATMSLSPEIAPVRASERLDWPRLERWLLPRVAEVLPGVDGPLEVLQFPNGSANLTYLLRVGAHEVVLRRALTT